MTLIISRPKLTSSDNFPIDWHPLIKDIYASRLNQVSHVEKRLKYLIPPDGLPDLDKAVKRLVMALYKKESILIYSCSNVDSICSTALLIRVLSKLGANITYLLFKQSFHHSDLSQELRALNYHPDVLIVIGNDIYNLTTTSILKQQCIDLIIISCCDTNETLPIAHAVVNPKRKDSVFPLTSLSEVGIAFYLLIAVRRYLLKHKKDFSCELIQYLDLVALGSIAALVPLDYNNRILVHYGIQLIHTARNNMGIRALCSVAGVQIKKLTTQDINFAIAPRLNAAGRIGDIYDSIALLLTDDWATAQEYAIKLDNYNRARRSLENDITSQAIHIIDPTMPLVNAYHPAWHEGIIDVVADRLKSQFSRPALIATDTVSKKRIKASLRSINRVDIHTLLRQVVKRLPPESVIFDGEAMSVDLIINKTNYTSLISLLNQSIELALRDKAILPYYIDGELPGDLFNLEWACYLEPWGVHFPPPIFYNRFIVLECRQLGMHHMRLKLRELKSGQQLLASCFFQGSNLLYGQQIDMAYQLQVNRFYGDERLELLAQVIQLTQ